MSVRNHNFVFEEKWKEASKKMSKNIIGGFGIGLCVSLLLWSIIFFIIAFSLEKKSIRIGFTALCTGFSAGIAWQPCSRIIRPNIKQNNNVVIAAPKQPKPLQPLKEEDDFQ